jgi:hypothetical protein
MFSFTPGTFFVCFFFHHSPGLSGGDILERSESATDGKRAAEKSRGIDDDDDDEKKKTEAVAFSFRGQKA